MLILERKLGETVVIKNGYNKIEIKLYKDQNGNYKLGFNAPPQYYIYRKELE